jgi:hypothetical protein
MKYDIDDEFENFMRRVYPDVLEHSIQFRECRRVFLSGAASMFLWLEGLAAYPENHGVDALADVSKQLEEFFYKQVGFNR